VDAGEGLNLVKENLEQTHILFRVDLLFAEQLGRLISKAERKIDSFIHSFIDISIVRQGQTDRLTLWRKGGTALTFFAHLLVS